MAYIGNSPGLGTRQLFRYVATASQTTFGGADSNSLTLNYTPGLLDVYIDGRLIPPIDYTATNGSTVVFSSGLSAGMDVIFNAFGAFSPANTFARDQNGADILNVLQFLTNLGIATSLAIPGQRGEFFMPSAPSGWLKANAAVVDRTVYATLDSAIYCGDANNATAAWGYRTNSSDTVRSTTGTHIKLPDGRGEFSRGWDDGRGVDSGRTLWSTQAHALQDHTHQITGYAPAGSFAQDGASVALSNVGNQPTSGIISGNVATETRPRNIVALVCIKY